MVDEVLREIERIQGYISTGRLTQFDEANTKATAIEPILRELDWDVVDPDEVTREYSVGNRSVDYALFCDSTLKVFIEAKNGGESLERHQHQLLDYAFAEGVEIAILTNGSTWWFYLPIRPVSWERRKVANVELGRQDSTEIAQKLVDLLSKGNIGSERAIKNAERHQIVETLPKIWNQLIAETDSSIVNLLVERMKGLCVRKPDRNEVEQFLSSHSQQIQIVPPPTAPEPVPTPEPTTVPEPAPGPNPLDLSELTTCKAFTFRGIRYEVSFWRDTLVKLCEIINTAHSDRFEEVLNLRGTTRSYFSRNPSDLHGPRLIDGTDIFVDAKYKGRAERIVKRLIPHFGYDESDLSFE